MVFEKRKASTLASLRSNETDKSPKGSLDTPIIPLLNALNNHPSYFTTSSCSGRISILSQPKSCSASKKKARGGTWLFITHDTADPDSVISLLFAESFDLTRLSELVFRFEPLIIAVECKDLSSAQNLVSLAISCGFRESGITSVSKRVIVGIRCSIRMEVPLGDTQKIMVSKDYVRFLVEVANEKMEVNRKRTDGFLRAFLKGQGGAFEHGNGSICSEGFDCYEGQSGLQRSFEDAQDAILSEKASFSCEPLSGTGVPSCSLSVTQMANISGEPIESLFLWGHSACTLDNTDKAMVLVFGGFGGIGRHERRNDCLLLDPLHGTLKEIEVVGCPSPRLGHTSSLVGDSMFVIGGRADPLNILSDVWILNTVKNEWKLVNCSGSDFPPRHRHAAAAVGSEIYVFGGLNNELISSSLHVLDTNTLRWEELKACGEWPFARHSHSMVAYGSKLLMFGGYNGEKALDDLYSFDIQTRLWKEEKVKGRSPHARFSHSMFVYKNYIGLIGGCPVQQHFQELALLDMRSLVWKHVILNSMNKELFVRCSANVVHDDLVVVGGGAACYAFGTKFSEPMKIDLLPLLSLDDHGSVWKKGEKEVNNQDEGMTGNSNDLIKSPRVGNFLGSTESSESQSLSVGNPNVASPWVVQLERNYAKLGKDILKKFGWLDLERKVYAQGDGLRISFPVTEKFCAIFQEDKFEGMNNHHPSKPFKAESLLLNEVSSSEALDILKKCGATKLPDEVVEARKASKSPMKIMTEAVASLIKYKGLPIELLEQLPNRWERLGDIVVLPVSSFKDPVWDSIGDELWPLIARSLNTCRLARQGRVAPNGTRDSSLEILVGDSGWVDHRENGILYSFDATKCMFSWGNLSEKIRMANLDCTDEVIVDLFAGIGYFVLPFLVRAKAKLVYACEWNLHAIEALRRNLQANSVSDCCIILEGDNRITAPKRVADRVCLGLLPLSEGSWLTAVRALRSEGGILHVHGNVKDTEEELWTKHVSKSIYNIARSEGHRWEVSIDHVERVKWYAPHIRHLVADVRCRQIVESVVNNSSMSTLQ